MATQGIEEVTENAIRSVARDCGSLSMECSDVAGYVRDVGTRITEHLEHARPARGSDDPPARRPGARFGFDRRSAAAFGAGPRQARSGPRSDRRHHRRLQGPDRPRRPARRAHGGLRLGDEPGPDGFLDDRDDRPQDQHACAERDHRGGPRRRCRPQLRGRRRRSEEARPRHARGDQPDRVDDRRADPRGRRGHHRDQDRRRAQPRRPVGLRPDQRDGSRSLPRS